MKRHLAITVPPAATVLSAAVVGVSVLVLAGWALGIGQLTRFAPGFAAMVPSTALGLCALALALARLCAPGPPETRRLALRTARIVAIAMSALALAGFAIRETFDVPGIDSVLFPRAIGGDGTAFATSILTLAAAYGLGHVATPSPRSARRFEAVATIGLALSLVACVGYIFDASSLYNVVFFTSMALPTAACFALLFTGLLCARRSETWLRFFFGQGAGNATARRMVPVVVIGPLCFAALELSAAGYVLPSFAYAVITIVLVAISTVAIAINAAIENAAEARSAQLTERLRQSNVEKELLLAELHHRVKNNIQQIVSIISMKCRNIDDPAVHDQFQALSARIKSIGSVHELLMLSPTSAEIDLRDFVERLGAHIKHANALEQRGIVLAEQIDAVVVPLETAVTTGLLISELVMNSIKHAFASGGGAITVRLARKGALLQLVVHDDGVGIGAQASGNGLGSKITMGLVRKLGGSMDVCALNGTMTTVEFFCEES